jgi:Prion-inhibition and propagation
MVTNGNSIAGTAVGSASPLIQLFQGCLDGFKFWQKSQKVGLDAITFCQTVVDFSGAFALSDWLMLLSQHSLPYAYYFLHFLQILQIASNSIESTEIESIAQAST